MKEILKTKCEKIRIEKFKTNIAGKTKDTISEWNVIWIRKRQLQ